ncbi:MAG: hypothetical protein JWM83_1590 [Candidatus Angelobacter sp.]|jgi:hypothetical protein|nr:hypothetical protein [Candidatus Angelobacter sp.]
MMQSQTLTVNSKLRLSGALIALGLLVQAISLLWNHPLSFIAFISIGGLLVAVGILVYLVALVSISTMQPDEAVGVSGSAQTPQP